MDTVEDDFRIRLNEPLDLNELCNENGEGSTFEVCLPEDEPDNTGSASYFDTEDVFKQLNYEVNDHGGSDEEDEMPFAKMMKNMEAVTPDGGVMKKVLKVGSGDIIGDRHTATVHYNGYFEYSDEPYDSTRLRNRPARLRLGDGKVIEGLEIAVSTMRKGEFSQFLVAPNYGFGPMGVPPRIPENATILFEVELLNISETPISSSLDEWSAESRKVATFPETLEIANGARKAGNEYFKDKRIPKATSQYGKAIRLLEDVRLADESEEVEMKRVILKLYLNMALCCIRQCQSTRALTYCNKALDIDENNVKAMFRKGQALLQISEFDRSHHWLSKAQRQSPNDSAIVRELAKLHTVRSKFQQLEKNMYSKMFQGPEKAIAKGAAKSDCAIGQEEKTVTKCPADVQTLLQKRLRVFADDEGLVEMPFPLETLTSAEIEYIQQTARDMNLQVRELHKNSDKYLKIYKPAPAGN